MDSKSGVFHPSIRLPPMATDSMGFASKASLNFWLPSLLSKEINMRLADCRMHHPVLI